jgi:Protein of unknown function (DUF2442)
MNPRIISVKALENYELELLFDNGETGIFSVRPYLQYDVYKPLADIALFEQARATMGFVSWNEDIDMSPDNLYRECRMVAHQ